MEIVSPQSSQSASDVKQVLVDLRSISKQFDDGGQPHVVLNDVDLRLNRGDCVALTGSSGCGKSTLLNLIAGFEQLDQGELWLAGSNTQAWKDEQWSDFRRHQLGVIFQQFNLLTPLNVHRNISFSLQLNGQDWNPWCDHLVEKLELTALLYRHVANLSGGQQQRVAIARALAHKPALLLADEPTGNLDHQTGLEVMSLITELAKQSQSAVLLVTHSAECAKFMNAQYHLDSGSLHAR